MKGLYSSRKTESSSMRADDPQIETESSIRLFDDEELQIALRRLKSGKAKDGKGFVAEMLKAGGVNLRKAMLQLMNAVLEANAPTPDEWHERVLKYCSRVATHDSPKIIAPFV